MHGHSILQPFPSLGLDPLQQHCHWNTSWLDEHSLIGDLGDLLELPTNVGIDMDCFK